MDPVLEKASELSFFVNGKEVTVVNPDPEMTLLYFIRNELCLKGSKLGCGEGGCGACTVMVSSHTPQDGVKHSAVNACLMPLCAVQGMAVTTVEGIGSTTTALHPCQERIARAHGSQCGFCTPGFVMSMYSLLRSNCKPSEQDIEEAFQGNLCRCTGYRPILDGFKTFAMCSASGCCMDKENCCMQTDTSPPAALFDKTTFTPLDPTQEAIFPAKLKLSGPPSSSMFEGRRVSWYRPTSLAQLLRLRNKFPHTVGKGQPLHRIVMGNTEIGIEVKFKGAHYQTLIFCIAIPELNRCNLTEQGLLVGGAVTITDLARKLTELVETLPGYKTRLFSAMLEMLRWFAGQQIRNVATLGGNVCNASPISDLTPLLGAAGALLYLESVECSRSIPINAAFFTGYKQTAIKPNEVLVSILLPFTAEHEYLFGYKQSRRREDDIAIVNAGLRVHLEEEDDLWKVKESSLCFGGMSYITAFATQTQQLLCGRLWEGDLLEEAMSLLLKDFLLAANVPGGMPEYRRSLVISFFFKFYWSVKNLLPGASLDPRVLSVTEPRVDTITRSSQGFQAVPGLQAPSNPKGRPIMHRSALLQASGEARYIDDIPRQHGELYAGLVMSTRAHANFSVDWSRIEHLEGVHGHVSAEDVPGSNRTGVFGDELVFADRKVTHFGQFIGMVLADNQLLAQQATKLVHISYEDLPSIITIEDAISSESFYPVVRKIGRGDFSVGYQDSPVKLQGSVRVGGQDHFYLEPHGCLVIPKGEDGEMEIYASTQAVDGTQKMAAKALGVDANRIVARVKRIGGGFGGKETRSFILSTPLAVAAHKFQKPVRAIMDRNEDMIATGGRHPFLGHYKVGFTEVGDVLALELSMYSNAGASVDLTYGVNERAITHADNVYNIPNLALSMTACRTNLPSNTAFRGFGGPQGMMIMEQVMSQVARHLVLPPEDVRWRNMYREGDLTPYDMPLTNCNIRRCWEELMKTSSFTSRKSAVAKYNLENGWKKCGIAMVPTRFGVSFGLKKMCQGGALLLIYTDGSVLLSHGGMEMGQGLHTKMVQVCAHLLGIPLDKVHIQETSSSVVPNASPTAASYSTDLYGMAVKDCCEQILDRLAPVKESLPEAGWEEWVREAYEQRINLSAQGFYTTPNLGMNWDTGKGNVFHYFAYGASCSEVEVDTLTGDVTVLRTDIVMDVGDSINPAIDIGQVEGAFMQGLGLFTMEECVYLEGGANTQRGQMFTTGPGTYKIPSCKDAPLDFRVSLLGRAPNPKAIFSSKAVGEPPLFLAASVLLAIEDAVQAARAEAGIVDNFHLDTPATCERIRLACSDHLLEQVKGTTSSEDSCTRWTIEA